MTDPLATLDKADRRAKWALVAVTVSVVITLIMACAALFYVTIGYAHTQQNNHDNIVNLFHHIQCVADTVHKVENCSTTVR